MGRRLYSALLPISIYAFATEINIKTKIKFDHFSILTPPSCGPIFSFLSLGEFEILPAFHRIHTTYQLTSLS